MEIGGTETRIRQDIQVLRGFAVAVVLLFHLGYGVPAGGYLGVDVFFVISGYLITQIIARDRDAGRFSLGQFYFRRAKRLLPAALVMLLLTSIASFWLLTSLEMQSFTKQLFGAATFSANWVLIKETGYFDADAATKPLLHMWSLAIEGQFYLLLPILLIRLPRTAWLAIVGLVCIASVVFYLVQLQFNADYAFYWTGTRIWELAIGGVIALYPLGSRLGRAVQLLFWPALAAILIFVARPRLLPFDGIEVVLTCVATAIVIQRRHPIFDARAFRPLAATGDASYSLYLAHWPPMAFLWNAYFGPPLPSYRLAALVLGIVLGLLIYRLVETPCRGAWLRPSWRSVAAFPVLILLVAGVQTGVNLASVYPAFDYAGARAPNDGLDKKDCPRGANHVPSLGCETSDNPAILVWGDSFAMHLVGGIVATSRNGIRQATRSACAPYVTHAFLTGSTRVERTKAINCLAFHKLVLKQLAASPSIRLVVISSPFAQAYRMAVVDTPHGPEVISATGDTVRQALDDTIASIVALGRKVVVVSPPPREQGDTSTCLERVASKKITFGKRDCTIRRRASDVVNADPIALLKHVETGGTEVIWLADGLCAGDVCKTDDGGAPIYRDRGHLSNTGTIYVARALHLGEHLDALVAKTPAP